MIKRYHSPEPPAGRLLLHAAVPKVAKQAVRQICAGADPVLLMDEIRAAQEALGHWVDRQGLAKETLDPATADISNLASAA